MDFKELSAYIASLLRSEAEVVASFFMGVLLTIMLAFSLRRWVSPGHDSGAEIARKDAEIARKDSELARKDAQIAVCEARLTMLEGRLLDEGNLVTTLRRRDATVTEQYAAIEAGCAKLRAENHQLQQINQAFEADAANMRTRLAQALSEAEHWAKWSRLYDEENARLAEIGSLREG